MLRMNFRVLTTKIPSASGVPTCEYVLFAAQEVQGGEQGDSPFLFVTRLTNKS